MTHFSTIFSTYSIGIFKLVGQQWAFQLNCQEHSARKEMAALDYIIFCTVVIAILQLLLAIYEARTNRQAYLLKLCEMEEGSAQGS